MNDLARTFKVLADPIRLRIVMLLLGEGELCVCDLMAVLELPQSTVSRHLAYLKRSGWLDGRRQGVWMYYRISVEACPLCRETLEVLARHAGGTPCVLADRTRLISFLKDKPNGCS